MVRRSLEAANAIRAGNSNSLIASVSMIVVLARELPPAIKLRRACLRFG